MRQSLERIDAVDGVLHAFVLRLDERATRLADERDRERASGRLRSALHGVPVAVKDLFDIEGYRTGSGSRSFPNHRAAVSASAVRKLEEAGAVIVGKTHTVEFAFGGWGTNPVLGAPVNPYDSKVHRAPGGSSSGSAVAVASGMVPLALGTDTGGSIRIPAAFCGLFGHKSTPGLISRGGMRYLSPSHDSVGALARSVRDLRAAMGILAGPDVEDTATLALPAIAFGGRDEAFSGSIRFATLDDPALERLDDEVRQRFRATLDRLGDRLDAIGTLRLPVPLATMCDKAGRLMSAESYASLHTITEDPATDVAPEIRARINLGRSISASEVAELHALKRQWKAQFAEAFAGYDILVMPGVPIAPPPLSDIDQSNMVLSLFGRYVNMLDLCAASVPVGLTSDGLPIGITLIGRGLDDWRVLAVAAMLEREALAALSPPVGFERAPS
ncbi:amidase [Ancylobacter amanitiformis]|uniref:Indoleacetamide hydrolase n=1 Tax=Ancylobacter amanitiformis TaxID=217069 RepID=A0ABU0LX24_9HYPH|nr:amidase [Ancylobacter amanitiformis]MDQ0513239.1 aspartyl-tRNA(Asn)/glutamyl-tRNA(Gln) amidotransferase subunit A [Ancylobacter amanitiformis]